MSIVYLQLLLHQILYPLGTTLGLSEGGEDGIDVGPSLGTELGLSEGVVDGL